MLFRYGNKVYAIYTCVEPPCGNYAGEVPDDRIVYEIYDIPDSVYPKIKAAIPEGVEVDYDNFTKLNYNPYDHGQNSADWVHTSVSTTLYNNSTDYIKDIIDDLNGFTIDFKSDEELGSGVKAPVQESNEDQFELDLDFPDAE